MSWPRFQPELLQSPGQVWIQEVGSQEVEVSQWGFARETGAVKQVEIFKELWIVNVFFWHQSLIIAGFTILLSIVVCDQS